MNSNSRQMSYVLLFLFSIILAYNFFPSFQENVLSHLRLKWEIILVGNISIDLFGALIPIVVSVLLALYLLFFRSFSWKRYLLCLSLALSFGLLTSHVNGAIVIHYQLFDYVLAILVFFLAYFQETSLRSLSLDSIVISKQNYMNSLLMIYSVGVFGIFLVDLTCLLFTNTMKIGAAGLIDAIFLSGLFSFFPLTIVVSSFGILLEEKRKMMFPLHRKKYENLKKQIPELLITIILAIVVLYSIVAIVPSLNQRQRMDFGAIMLVLIFVFVFVYSGIKNYIESQKQKKLNHYLRFSTRLLNIRKTVI